MENNQNNDKKITIEDIINNSSDNLNKKNEEQNKDSTSFFDIKLDSIENFLKYLIKKEYDFFTLEPEEEKVKLTFRKNNQITEENYISYPIYNKVLLKAKALTKLDVSNISEIQEGKVKIQLNNSNYNLISKTVPGKLGERLFLKAKKDESKIVKKKEKMSFGKMISIFGGLLFTTLLLGGAFLTVILFRSTSVSDLQFFNNLGIDTNAIKDFAFNLVNWTFGIILLVIIIFLFVFTYKTILTKKTLKRKRAVRMIISIFLLILSILTLILWMFLAQKINSLRGINYGKVEYFDNSRYISKLFGPKEAKLDITQNIIGPITIRFNIKEFILKLLDEGFKPKNIVWQIDGKIIEKPGGDYELIYEFNQKKKYDIKLKIIGENLKQEKEEKQKDLGTINITNIVKIKEIKLDNGGSRFVFDASDLKNLGKIKWYYIPSLKGKTEKEAQEIINKALKKEKLIGYKFVSKNIFEGEEYYGIKIVGVEEKDELDKIFIISKGNLNDIKGKIVSKKDLENPNKYSFSFKKEEKDLTSSYIKEFIWEIYGEENNTKDNKIIIKKKANLANLEESSKISYTFKIPGEHKIVLKVIDSNDKENIFKTKINISKQIQLKNHLLFEVEGKKLKPRIDYNYEKDDNIYYIEDIKSPTSIKINATYIKSLNPKYSLNKVYWDINNDGNFEKEGKIQNINIFNPGISTFKVKYEFKNKIINNDIINTYETISITSIKKEALLDLKIIKANSYVPIVVSFDASNSKVPGKDIDKFIFDYGDGTPEEERDAKNTGHKYIKAGNYNVKLIVVTTDGSKYSISKKIVLKEKPQKAIITLSMKKAPRYQEIDFSAEDSIGEIASYFWDFGDGNISTEVSPSHAYKKAGKYKVKLKLETTNKNILIDEKQIEIY